MNINANTSTELYRAEHVSKGGRAVIILREMPAGNPFQRYSITALEGHELLPGTKSFRELGPAKAYANIMWARY